MSRAATPAKAAALKRAARPTPAAPLPPPTRGQILAAAARLFGQQGFASTTLRQIAEAAGIQAGSIYYHFEGKDEIAACVLDAGIEALAAAVRERMDGLPQDADVRMRLRAAVEGHLWGMLHHADFTAAHIRIYRNVSDAARRRHAPLRRAYTRRWDDLLGEAVGAGALRSDMPVPMIRQYLIGALNWPVDWYDPRRGSVGAFAAQIASLVFQGIVVAAPDDASTARATPRATGRGKMATRRAETVR
jgi:AcrR family transcriptional regulator